MFGLGNLSKSRNSKSNISGTETPITHLSKILSKTNFIETSSSAICGYGGVIPVDIDESANQEPPTESYSTWIETNDIFRESNTNSSGYYSSTTQSAPSTCDHPLYANYAVPKSTNLVNEKCDVETSQLFSDVKLRRSKSCVNRSWLAKTRKIHSYWPKISGISTNTSKEHSIVLASIDTNSCPAAITTDIEHYENHKLKYSLPPLGEVRSSSSSDTSPIAAKIMNFSSGSDSPSPKRRLADMTFDNFYLPERKKQRTSSFTIESPRSCAFTKLEIDSTLPSEDLSSELNDVVSDPPKFTAKSTFDLLRHHSTPMPPSYNFNPHDSHCPESPIDPIYISALTRSSSDPLSDVAEKTGRLDDNQSQYFDGQRARVLPVIERTASGMNCVTVDTVSDLISTSKYQVNHVIVDCRFPYEYEGGHIQGAINIFTHSDLVQEIFDRVPAQRPPGSKGPPQLLGQWLAKRLAKVRKESQLAPYDLISDEEVEDLDDDVNYTDVSSDTSDLEIKANVQDSKSELFSASDNKSDIDASNNSQLVTNLVNSNPSPDSPFVVIFHCEFSSQRAPALATFLRSVDRVSNYHRYPFLYFPEIYIMKGGYSAFYQKYSPLCCPQTYVKMFHRDYRNHLRVYKRLTRRVGTACLACIRPHQKELDNSEPTVAEMDSFYQLFKQPPKTVLIPANFDSPLIDCQLTGKAKLRHSLITSTNPDFEDKENQYSSESSLNSSDSTNEICNATDSSLNLAEVVVRVGRRVVAATLCSGDPATSEIAQALEQFKKRSLNYSIDTSLANKFEKNTSKALHQKPIMMKRSNTTSILDIRPSRISFGNSTGDILNETNYFEQISPNYPLVNTITTPKRALSVCSQNVIEDLCLSNTPISLHTAQYPNTNEQIGKIVSGNTQSFDCGISTFRD